MASTLMHFRGDSLPEHMERLHDVPVQLGLACGSLHLHMSQEATRRQQKNRSDIPSV